MGLHSDRALVRKCGGKITRKKDDDGYEYTYIQMDEAKEEWIVQVQVLHTYRISVFADDSEKARTLADCMQTLQFADEGSLESVDVTDILIRDVDD